VVSLPSADSSVRTSGGKGGELPRRPGLLADGSLRGDEMGPSASRTTGLRPDFLPGDASRIGDLLPTALRPRPEATAWVGHGFKSWAVDWLAERGIPKDFCIAWVCAMGGKVSSPEAVGALAGWRLPSQPLGRRIIGLMVCGAKRRWTRRVPDWEIAEASIFKALWPDTVSVRKWRAVVGAGE
jgi:hypothetical protein